MSNVFKVALPGYEVDDTNPDHFALFVDQQTDYILIKEKLRGSQSVNATGVNVAHGLGYVPLVFAFVEISAGVWRKLFSNPIDTTGYWFTVNSTNVVLSNNTGVAKTFAYYIFYDNIT